MAAEEARSRVSGCKHDHSAAAEAALKVRIQSDLQ